MLREAFLGDRSGCMKIALRLTIGYAV
jgi:hypothetical protein